MIRICQAIVKARITPSCSSGGLLKGACSCHSGRIMRILLLGATGYIGSAVLSELLSHGHSILALAHHARAEESLARQGADVLTGDIRQPQAWAAALQQVDAVVHLAATFTEDMGAVDDGLIEAFIAAAAGRDRRLRFLYTGGCWLYGATGDRVADENDPLSPFPSFAWMPRNFEKIKAVEAFEAVFLHPAMVYDRDGGTLSRFIEGARDNGVIEIIGSLDTRWPLVQLQDLASAYRLALTEARPGEAYNLATEDGVAVKRLAAVISKRFGLERPPQLLSRAEAIDQLGSWAAGPALDQQMSGAKARRALGWQPKHVSIFDELS